MATKDSDTLMTIDYESVDIHVEEKWSNISPFYEVIKTTATCKKCNKSFKIQPTSTSNLKVHYQRSHPDEYDSLKSAFERRKRGGRKNNVKTVNAAPGTSVDASFNQKECLDLYYKSFISCMKAASETDNEDVRALWKYACPQFQLPSRRKLTRDVSELGNRAKADLVDLLAKQEFVATTADSWSAIHRAFLGMTVTWLDRSTLERQSAVLGIKEVTVSQTGKFLAESIMEILDEFGIKRKVVSITTDNGANYISALDQYSAMERGDAEQLVEDEDEVVKISSILVEDALEQSGLGEEVVQIPKHRRCAAHTLNLLASKDAENVPGWSGPPRPVFLKPAGKAQALWNAQNRKTITANDIKETLGRKLPTPGVTRWNSSHDAYKFLSTEMFNPEKRNNINQISQRQRPHPLPSITDHDVKVWAEYVKVTTPIAVCLDVLQGEDKAYMGCLLPNLQLVKDSLEGLAADDQIIHAKNLITRLLKHPSGSKGFEGRFGHLFEDADLLMATAMHPWHKLVTVKAICRRQQIEHMYDLIRTRLVREVFTIVSAAEDHQYPVCHQRQQPGPQPGSCNTDSFFEFDDDLTDEDLEEEVRETAVKWSRTPLRGNPKLDVNQFPLQHRDAYIRLFIKYNTSIPSSAAIERVFSYGSDILRPKRSALSAANFEALVFMKGNLHLLQKTQEIQETRE